LLEQIVRHKARAVAIEIVAVTIAIEAVAVSVTIKTAGIAIAIEVATTAAVARFDSWGWNNQIGT
jgi:hypothetical protein